jgi:hypothetical protein
MSSTVDHTPSTVSSLFILLFALFCVFILHFYAISKHLDRLGERIERLQGPISTEPVPRQNAKVTLRSAIEVFNTFMDEDKALYEKAMQFLERLQSGH